MKRNKQSRLQKVVLIIAGALLLVIFLFIHSSLNVFAGFFFSSLLPNLKAIPVLEFGLAVDRDGVPVYRSPLHFEGHYAKDPYIDTIFADDFSPEKFEQVKVGMSKTQVEELLGEPFTKDSFGIRNPENANEIIMPNDPRAEDCWRYSSDGKLGKEGDTSWYSFLVCFKKDIVLDKQANEFND